MTAPDVLVVGGGMITHDQILPSLFHMQREGRVGQITVVAQHARTVENLARAPDATYIPSPRFLYKMPWSTSRFTPLAAVAGLIW